jgi:DNA polymerase-3 subunit alpha
LSRFEVHTHSEYSNLRLLDSINKIPKLINRAVELGLSGITITDHECLCGHPEANFYAEEINKEHPDFKVALGNEIYLTENRSKGQKYYHFILIAKNKMGYKALRELSSYSWMNSYWDRGIERVPTTYLELENILAKYPNSLIGTTACLGGELSSHILNLIKAEKHSLEDEIREIKISIINFVKWCKEIFGDDFYIECAPGRSSEQIAANKRLMSIAHTFNCKMVIGTDAHYLTKKDRYSKNLFYSNGIF